MGFSEHALVLAT